MGENFNDSSSSLAAARRSSKMSLRLFFKAFERQYSPIEEERSWSPYQEWRKKAIEKYSTNDTQLLRLLRGERRSIRGRNSQR